MDITETTRKLIRNKWDPHAEDRGKPQIATELIAEERLGAASFMTGMKMGIALGEAKTPEEAIARIEAITI